MRLTNDTCRCLGEQTGIHTCTRRETCARYTQRNTGGPSTPYSSWLCPGPDHFYQSHIPIKSEMEPK